MRGAGGGPALSAGSRYLSAAGIRFLGIRFPPQNSASLTVGLPGTNARTTTGLPRSACLRPSRGGCRLCPGAAVFARPAKCLRPPPAASQRPALHPGTTTTHPGLTLTRRHRRFAHAHPSGLPFACDSGWHGAHWACSPSFAPRRYQRRTSEQGRALNTCPGLRHRQHRRPPPTRPLTTCDLVSHHLRDALREQRTGTFSKSDPAATQGHLRSTPRSTHQDHR